jgi:hypothetical protein
MNVPGTFYKYRSLSGEGMGFLESLLRNNELYLSAPTNFNDPFDCVPTFDFACTREEAIALADRTLARDRTFRTAREKRVAKEQFLSSLPVSNPLEAHTHMCEAHEVAVRERLGVYCLSARMDSPLMWSHYADAHRGVCIGFDSNSWPFAIAQSVSYSEERMPVNPFRLPPDEALARSVLQKSADWTYEEEWRVVVPNGAGRTEAFEDGAVTSVIFGARFPVEQEEVVRALVARHDPVFYRARPSSQRFAIEVDRLQT